ncbi:hypothetical protein P154DRAFT_557626 [Amniculicola lignicola CBS 123094]|uniref:FAR-17a/AIG1-like protein n=1 Tax=Amniculicola lignicola CBS 123094 TaxID=1392246 RepID=A0A6A5VY78_9PLEO|nr:hypothetical protein P154DRAFT_557626 [Amniculicola lignicola CBS 123094]
MALLKRLWPVREPVFDPTFRYETSWILPPGLLFTARVFLSLYAFTTIFTIFGIHGSQGEAKESEESFSYFTNLTYWGLAFYNAFSAVHTGSYWLRGKPFLASWPRVLQVAHSMFYSTIVVYPFIVTIVFWALLFSHFTGPFDAWTNTSQHALNSVYALFEIVFPRTAPLPWLHIPVIVVILAFYLAVAYITEATKGFFVYDFLDNKTHSPGVVAGYCIGILVGAILIFVIVRYLIVLRVWVTEKKLGNTGKFSKHGGVGADEHDYEKGIPLGSVSAK